MRLALRLALLPACAMTLLTGCEPNQLYLASHTVVGVNAAVSPDQTSGWLIVGYDRTFATVIPRSAKGKTEDGAQTHEAMSALACSSLSVKGITIKRYTESIATGEAAKKFAEKLKADKNGAVDDKAVAKAKDLFDCFKDKPAAGNPQ
jgi:hypothetical protein